jgi:hypothetical protein
LFDDLIAVSENAFARNQEATYMFGISIKARVARLEGGLSLWLGD